jgi:hypothetical protein
MTARRNKPVKEVAFETWTWQDAEEALKKNVSNRHLREADVAKYARSMKARLWGNCVAPMCFDWDGNFIDGQHRAHAQVVTRTTREWLVYRNLPPETQKNIDTGLPRAPYDQLRFEGYGNSIVLASTARWAFALKNDLMNVRIKVASEEIVQMVKKHEDLVHSAYMGQQARQAWVAQLSPSPVAAAHWWVAQHNDHAEADMFIDRMIHLNHEPDGSPVLAMMKRFSELNRPRPRQHVPTRDQIAFIIKTWNYDVDRRYVSKMNLYTKSGDYRLQPVKKREISQSHAQPELELVDSPDDDE